MMITAGMAYGMAWRVCALCARMMGTGRVGVGMTRADKSKVCTLRAGTTVQIEDTARDEGDNLRLQIILGHRIGWVYAEGHPDEGPHFEVLSARNPLKEASHRTGGGADAAAERERRQRASSTIATRPHRSGQEVRVHWDLGLRPAPGFGLCIEPALQQAGGGVITRITSAVNAERFEQAGVGGGGVGWRVISVDGELSVELSVS
jgi:hypothetical protein